MSDVNSNDIVGHKTIDTGKRDQYGLPIFRREPITRAEVDGMWNLAEAAARFRAEMDAEDGAEKKT